jgi:hypothetical protein
MGVFTGDGYGFVRVRECQSRERKRVLEQIHACPPPDGAPGLPPGYTLDTSTEDTHPLRRADGSLVCTFVPENVSAEVVRRVAERDNLLSRGRRTLAHHRWLSR